MEAVAAEAGAAAAAAEASGLLTPVNIFDANFLNHSLKLEKVHRLDQILCTAKFSAFALVFLNTR